MSTLIISLVLLGVVYIAIRSIRKKKGGCSCGDSCAGCGGSCHTGKDIYQQYHHQ